MERFFAPAPAPGDANKRLKPGEDPSAPRRSDPASFVTWNANSLLGRLRKDLDKSSFFAYVEEKDPDVICLQETWLPAAGPDRCARPRTAPARPVHDVGTHHPTPSFKSGHP